MTQKITSQNLDNLRANIPYLTLDQRKELKGMCITAMALTHLMNARNTPLEDAQDILVKLSVVALSEHFDSYFFSDFYSNLCTSGMEHLMPWVNGEIPTVELEAFSAHLPYGLSPKEFRILGSIVNCWISLYSKSDKFQQYKNELLGGLS